MRYLVLVVCLLSCGDKPPSKVTGAPSTPPDESYQVGAVGGLEGFIWTCTAGEHVHMSRGCGEFLGCGSWTVERAPCGGAIASEPPPANRRPMEHASWR
jgi:hypothetical protein